MPASPTLTDAAATPAARRKFGDLARHHLKRAAFQEQLDPAGKAGFRSAHAQFAIAEHRRPRRRSHPTTMRTLSPSSGNGCARARTVRPARLARAARRSSRADRAPRPAPPAGSVREGQVSLSVPLRLVEPQSQAPAPLCIGRISIGTGSAASRAASERAVDHMIFELAGVVFADGPAAGRLARFMHRLAAAGDEIMPLGQRLARGPQPIRAGARQPIEAARDSCGPASRSRTTSFLRFL